MLRKLSLAVLLVVSGMAATAHATGVPQVLTEEGRLADESGSPITNAVSITFTIYDAPTGGNVLWSEAQTVTVTNGYFAARLGEGVPFPAGTFDGSTRYLGVQAG